MFHNCTLRYSPLTACPPKSLYLMSVYLTDNVNTSRKEIFTLPLRLFCGLLRNELDTHEIIEPCELHLVARFPWQFVVTKQHCPSYNRVMSSENSSLNDLTIVEIRELFLKIILEKKSKDQETKTN